MKSLIEYKEDIYKCSKCGLCQSVCPVYKITKNECILSRGRFTILNGILQNRLILNKKIIKNIDTCLNCNACKNFCPSNINAKEIFASVKNEFNSTNKNIHGLFHSQWFFEFKMNTIKLAANSYRFFLLDKLVDILAPLLLKLGVLGKRILLANSIIKINVKRKKALPQKLSKGKIVFFEGCYNKYINPSSKNSALNLIEEMGYEVVKLNLKCCGISSYYSGHFKEFEKQAESIIKTIPDNIEAIVCDCSSCISVLKSYYDFFPNAKQIKEKTISAVQFLEKNNYKKTFNKKYKVTYHKPCHSEYSTENFLKNIENIEYITLKNNDTCCGFSGEFAIKYRDLSRKISAEKAKDIIDTNAQIVITSCPSCIMGLTQGLLETKEIKHVLNITEFLNLT